MSLSAFLLYGLDILIKMRVVHLSPTSELQCFFCGVASKTEGNKQRQDLDCEPGQHESGVGSFRLGSYLREEMYIPII